MGARIEERPDGMVIHGPARLHGAVVDSHHDHRLAMALAVAGLVADGETRRAATPRLHRRLLPGLRRNDAGAGGGYPVGLIPAPPAPIPRVSTAPRAWSG